MGGSADAGGGGGGEMLSAEAELLRDIAELSARLRTPVAAPPSLVDAQPVPAATEGSKYDAVQPPPPPPPPSRQNAAAGTVVCLNEELARLLLS